MLDTYLGDLARCATPNQVNRLHITLEDVLAPAEMCALIDGARGRRLAFPANIMQWFARQDVMVRGGGRPVQGYLRKQLAPGARAYAAPGDDRTRAERTLVVAFAGNVDRLMLPTAMFLQHCPAERYEFVVITDPTRTFYLSGFAGLGDDLPASIARLEELCAPSRFRRTVTFGTSAGGLAAIWTAVALGLDRAVSVGGVTPDEVTEDRRSQHLSAEGFVDALRCATRLPEVMLVFGEKAQRDTEKARTMSALLPATMVAVPGSADHIVLFDAWKAGGLDALLERVLGEGQASG